MILAVALGLALAAGATGASAAGARTGFIDCSAGLNTTRNIPAMAVFSVEVRGISCRTAYRLINNFPGSLKAKMSYAGYTCSYKFSAAIDGFAFLCSAGRRAYSFDAAGD